MISYILTLHLALSVCCNWQPGDVFDAGYMQRFDANLKYISLMRYPNNNCDKVTPVIPQDIFATYLSHAAAKNYVANFDPVVRESPSEDAILIRN